MNVLLLFVIIKECANLNIIIYFHIKDVETVCICSFMYLPFALSHLMPLYVFNVFQTSKRLQNVLDILLPTSVTHN